MSALKRKAFIRAYFGDAHGNATKAAELAGYSPHTAKQQGSRLLSHVDVQRALQRHAQKDDASTVRCIANVSAIANHAPQKLTGSEILKANELLLKVNGALRDKPSDSRVTVNIGFLTATGTHPHTVQVMASPTHIESSVDEG